MEDNLNLILSDLLNELICYIDPFRSQKYMNMRGACIEAKNRIDTMLKADAEHRCEKCGQKLPEVWVTPKHELSLVETAEQWQEGDEFSYKGSPDKYLFGPLGLSILGDDGLAYECAPEREDCARRDWYFTNRCPLCGQRTGGEGK